MEAPRTSLPERSASNAWPTLDRLSLAGLAFGLAAMLQPWWSAGFRLGFFLLLAATALQIVAGHLAPTHAAYGPRDPGDAG